MLIGLSQGELVVVIGKDARNLPEDANPMDYVLGYTGANDVSLFSGRAIVYC